MKKTVLSLFILFFGFTSIFAQETAKEETGPWKKGGHFGFVFAQSAFKNWMQGGENAMGGNLKVNYDAIYKKDKTDWTTKFIVNYGVSQVGDISKKTDDLFEVNSIYGRNIKNNWNFTVFGNFKTQFSPGYDYSTSPYTKISNAFAPAFLSFGPGISYKPGDNFYINFAPVTSRFIFVTDPALNAIGAFGVDPGKSSRYEFGANYQMFFKTNLMKNVSIENTLNLFSNYLDQPQNIDVDNMFTLRMKVNKFLSAALNLRSIYDDNTAKRLQLSEVFGVEFGFDF